MIATYRLQLNPEFGFADAEALVPYFRSLGISHLYLSPVTEARPGSTHGYDVIDHNRIREEYGGREAFDQLAATAHEAGLSLIIDFVPNHAGVGPNNELWQETLAYGPYSQASEYFDIDWSPLKPELQGRILLPFLGRTYGDVLDDDEIEITYDEGRFYATYYEHRFALTPPSYSHIFEAALPTFERTDPYWDVQDLKEAYGKLEPDEREKSESLRQRLRTLTTRVDPDDLTAPINENGLHELLEQQYWRLAYWKTAAREINYRRFFSINDLVALCMEKDEVFWDMHRLLGELLAQPGVDGVRIDHIDGLYDPHRYIEQLHELGANHIWVEKIVAPGETLPAEWDVEGTTGYEFLNDMMRVLLYPDGVQPLSRFYERYNDDAKPYADVAYESKELIIDRTLSSELVRLANELDRLSEADYHTRDFTLGALREALSEVVAAFDRYRTYLPYDAETAQAVIDEAKYRALQRNPAAEPTVFDFISEAIMGHLRDDLDPLQRAWVGRFQQYTAPVAAKGVEDTAFYRHVPLTALNEVGGEPELEEGSDHTFHARARFRAFRYPQALVATATHDHKRGEDTRMRLLTLAEAPDAWTEVVQALDDIGATYRGTHGPAASDAYLFYQTLVALWRDASGQPLDRDELTERLTAYMEKCAREAKRRTSWINPNEEYEADLQAFVEGIINDEETPDALDAFTAELSERGFFNTLSQTVVKCTVPGVPDFYQGTELPDLSLVDPDNRRAVDYDARRELLDEFGDLLDDPDAEAVHALLHEPPPRAKAFVTARLLRVRRAYSQLFNKGDYRGLAVSGSEKNAWLAFSRESKEHALVICVPRYPSAWTADEDASLDLPESLHGLTWTDTLTGTSLSADDQIDLSTLSNPWVVLVADVKQPEESQT